MKFKEFVKKIKKSNMDYFNSLTEHEKYEWKEEFKLINRAEQMRNTSKVSFTLIDDNAREPTKSVFGNVYSLFAKECVKLDRGGWAVVRTGVKVVIKDDTSVLLLCSDCSLTSKGIIMGNAADVLTAAHGDDEIFIVLHNLTDYPRHIEKNQRIARAIVVHTESVPINVERTKDDESL